MRLADKARARIRSQGPSCAVADALAVWGDELREALEDLELPATAIQDTLADDHDYHLSEFSIRRHRNGRCRC